jgi:hypothetical protein
MNLGRQSNCNLLDYVRGQRQVASTANVEQRIAGGGRANRRSSILIGGSPLAISETTLDGSTIAAATAKSSHGLQQSQHTLAQG